MYYLRCSRCEKLLAKIETKVNIEIKCPRCRLINQWNAPSVSECPSSTILDPIHELRERFIDTKL